MWPRVKQLHVKVCVNEQVKAQANEHNVYEQGFEQGFLQDSYKHFCDSYDKATTISIGLSRTNRDPKDFYDD